MWNVLDIMHTHWGDLATTLVGKRSIFKCLYRLVALFSMFLLYRFNFINGWCNLPFRQILSPSCLNQLLDKVVGKSWQLSSPQTKLMITIIETDEPKPLSCVFPVNLLCWKFKLSWKQNFMPLYFNQKRTKIIIPVSVHIQIIPKQTADPHNNDL